MNEKQKLTDESVLKFGAHTGKKLANVPASYLLWLYDGDLSSRPELKAYIIENMDVLKKEAGVR